jgi:hypothetical protein
VAAHRGQYAERDLVVLAFAPTGVPDSKDAPAPIHVLQDTPDIAALYRAAGGATAFYLIGKDGHIALARHGIPRDEELFALIDAMPMRRREMRERGR